MGNSAGAARRLEGSEWYCADEQGRKRFKFLDRRGAAPLHESNCRGWRKPVMWCHFGDDDGPNAGRRGAELDTSVHVSRLAGRVVDSAAVNYPTAPRVQPVGPALKPPRPAVGSRRSRGSAGRALKERAGGLRRSGAACCADDESPKRSTSMGRVSRTDRGVIVRTDRSLPSGTCLQTPSVMSLRYNYDATSIVRPVDARSTLLIKGH